MMSAIIFAVTLIVTPILQWVIVKHSTAWNLRRSTSAGTQVMGSATVSITSNPLSSQSVTTPTNSQLGSTRRITHNSLNPKRTPSAAAKLYDELIKIGGTTQAAQTGSVTSDAYKAMSTNSATVKTVASNNDSINNVLRRKESVSAYRRQAQNIANSAVNSAVQQFVKHTVLPSAPSNTNNI